MSTELKRGLEGVVVAESDLSYIDGDAGELIYRGYAIEELAREASYEETLYLLWHDELPSEAELAEFSQQMAAARELDDGVLDIIRELAASGEEPMAALRTITSALSATDPDADSEFNDTEANNRKSRRITAKMPTALAAYNRLRNGNEPVAPREELSHAANFLYMLNNEEPDGVLAETFDMALVLHADHGLNASTFAAMVTASTLADLHGAVTSAIGTLSGSLHGGANANVMRMLQAIDDDELDPVEWVKDAIDRGERASATACTTSKIRARRSSARRAKPSARPLATRSGTRCRSPSRTTSATKRASRRTSTSTRRRPTTKWASRSISTPPSSRSPARAAGSPTS